MPAVTQHQEDAPGEAARIERVRAFNRFYTAHLGVLREGLLGSEFGLSEARVLFEIAGAGTTAAKHLADDLELDAGYLSRMLNAFERRGVIERARSEADRRRRVIRLTAAGRETFADLDGRSRRTVERTLAALSETDQRRLLESMAMIETILRGAPRERARAYHLRPLKPGDVGWVAHRHGVLYHREYGWDQTFEALVARILGEFVASFDPRRERGWIAEMNGAVAGCVFLVNESEAVARLRCLLVEPAARGLGLGTHLVRECVDFARSCGYQRLTLWTNDVLVAARRIYERAGFTLTDETPQHMFGHDLVSQNWDLDLAAVIGT